MELKVLLKTYASRMDCLTVNAVIGYASKSICGPGHLWVIYTHPIE